MQRKKIENSATVIQMTKGLFIWGILIWHLAFVLLLRFCCVVLFCFLFSIELFRMDWCNKVHYFHLLLIVAFIKVKTLYRWPEFVAQARSYIAFWLLCWIELIQYKGVTQRKRHSCNEAWYIIITNKLKVSSTGWLERTKITDPLIEYWCITPGKWLPGFSVSYLP